MTQWCPQRFDPITPLRETRGPRRQSLIGVLGGGLVPHLGTDSGSHEDIRTPSQQSDISRHIQAKLRQSERQKLLLLLIIIII